MRIRCLKRLLWALTILTISAAAQEDQSCHKEAFTEEVLIHPLTERHTLVAFKFKLYTPPQKHFTLFPRSINQLSQAVDFRSFQLAFTRSRWQHEAWPHTKLATKPPGAELQVTFNQQHTPAHLQQSWGNITYALSGLFCASLNFLSKPTMYGQRAIRQGHMGPVMATHQPLLYAALPKEAVCTENLTPWLKLLPCRGQAGVGKLLHPYMLSSAEYFSMAVDVTKHSTTRGDALELDLTLTAVLSTGPPGPSPPHDLPSILTSSLSGACPLSSSSNLYVTLPGCGCSRYELPTSANCLTSCDQSTAESDAPSSSQSTSQTRNPNLDVTDCSTVAAFPTANTSGDEVVALLGALKQDAGRVRERALPGISGAETPRQGAPLKAQWQAVGSGGLHGKLVLYLELDPQGKQTGQAGGESDTPGEEGAGRVPSGSAAGRMGDWRTVCLFQMVPWNIRVWLRSLQLVVDGQVAPLPKHILLQRVSPAIDRKSPLTIDLCLQFPPNTTTATLSVDSTKSFLTVFEYPPDAHRGFDVPATLLWQPHTAPRPTGANGFKGRRPGEAAVWTVGSCNSRQSAGPQSTGQASPLLAAWSAPGVQQVYTEGLLIPSPTPDFSMPYNVCCLTSTVLAIFVGATLKLLLERTQQGQETEAKGKLQKLLKVVAVAALVGGVSLYVDPSSREDVMKLLGLMPAEVDADS